MQAINLSQATANAISRNSIPHFVGNGIANTIAVQSVFSAINCEACRGCAVSFGIETPKLMILF